jgi:beta-lactam-binding protein with PASTA domain
VNVDAATLTGQPAHVVANELRARGLQVHISWQPADHAQPGTVVAVSPDGAVPVGSTVTITAASRGHGGHGHDHGKGGGGHHGNGQGGD